MHVLLACWETGNIYICIYIYITMNNNSQNGIIKVVTLHIYFSFECVDFDFG